MEITTKTEIEVKGTNASLWIRVKVDGVECQSVHVMSDKLETVRDVLEGRKTVKEVQEAMFRPKQTSTLADVLGGKPVKQTIHIAPSAKETEDAVAKKTPAKKTGEILTEVFLGAPKRARRK